MPHPLFPVEDEDDSPPDVGWIQVTRYEGGRQVWAPHVFPANELQSLDDVAMKFGGGTYEFVARSADRARITARRRYVLPGVPIALDGSLGTTATDASAPGPPRPAPGDSLTSVMLAMMQMMSQQQQQSMQIVTAQQQQTMQLMATFMQASKSDAATLAKIMSDSTRERERSMSEFYTKLAESVAKPNDPETGFKWMELGMEMASKGEPAQQSDMTALMQGIATFAAFGNKGNAPDGKPS